MIVSLFLSLPLTNWNPCPTCYDYELMLIMMMLRMMRMVMVRIMMGMMSMMMLIMIMMRMIVFRTDCLVGKFADIDFIY